MITTSRVENGVLNALMFLAKESKSYFEVHNKLFRRETSEWESKLSSSIDYSKA